MITVKSVSYASVTCETWNLGLIRVIVLLQVANRKVHGWDRFIIWKFRTRFLMSHFLDQLLLTEQIDYRKGRSDFMAINFYFLILKF